MTAKQHLLELIEELFNPHLASCRRPYRNFLKSARFKTVLRQCKIIQLTMIKLFFEKNKKNFKVI